MILFTAVERPITLRRCDHVMVYMFPYPAMDILDACDWITKYPIP